jgi:glycosyltransferase involved in cell wall biosynthesis
MPDAAGLNIVGYFRAEVGVGEAARLLTAAVDRTGVPYVTIPYERTRSRQEHPFDATADGEARFDTTILCVNADQVANFASDAGRGFFDGRYTVAYWAWEVEPFPETMYRGFDFVDEIWTYSAHSAAAIAAVSPKPVLAMPPPIVRPPASAKTRAELGLPDGVVFLFVFDFLSILERKNPAAAVEAFTRAFAPNEGPHLVIKSINGDKKPEQLEQLRASVAGRGDIHVLDGYVSSEDKNALIASSDAFVSLHRSEGFGLTMAEAMALGTPVVATGYSGNLTFMDDANGYLVPYTLTAIPPGCSPYPAGGMWADPDLDAAAALMRRIHEHPEEAAEKARRAEADVRTKHAPEARAPMIADRLALIRRSRGRTAGRVAGTAIPSIEGSSPPRDVGRYRRQIAEHQVVPAPIRRADELIAADAADPAAKARGARGLTRRIFARLLAPYRQRQRHVNAALAESLRELHRRQIVIVAGQETMAWLIERIGRIQGEIGALRSASEYSADDLDRRVEALEAELAQTRAELDAAQRSLREASVIT